MKALPSKILPGFKTALLSVAMTTVISSAPSLKAHEAGDLIIRAGLTTVAPDTDSSTVNVSSVGDVGMGVDVDDGSALGINLLYMMNDQWGVELLAATPFSHDIALENTADNELGLGDGALAKTRQLPPTLSAVYYFSTAGAFQPYAGLGLNYTTFFDDNFKGPRKNQSFSDLELDDSFGVAAQLGFDYQMDNDWIINASIRYINIETDADFTVLGLRSTVSAEINPWVYSIMLGYHF